MCDVIQFPTERAALRKTQKQKEDAVVISIPTQAMDEYTEFCAGIFKLEQEVNEEMETLRKMMANGTLPSVG